MGRWHPTKPDKHPKLAVEVTLCHNAYGEIGFEAPNTEKEQHTTMVTAILDTGASMCLKGKCVTMRMGITRHDTVATTERLVGAKLPSTGNRDRQESMHSHKQRLQQRPGLPLQTRNAQPRQEKQDHTHQGQQEQQCRPHIGTPKERQAQDQGRA